MKRLFLLAVVILAAFWGGMIFGHYGVLLSESIRNPRENYVMRSQGTPREARQAKLICRYFNGRGFETLEFWHSPTGIGGLSNCPYVAAMSR